MKILVVFGSLLGKTKRKAVLIGHYLQKQGHEVVVKDARTSKAAEVEFFDLVILGSSTWDDGMLQFDFRPFNAELAASKYIGKNFAIFVLGSNNYPHPFAAAGILEKTVQTIGGKLIVETLKLEIDHDEAETKMDKEGLEWAEKINGVSLPVG
jgi:flavodoxin I